MQENDAESDFVKTVEEIKEAEKQSDIVVNNAKSKADAILRKAKETVLKEQSKVDEDAVLLKNKMLQEGKVDIEKDVKKILKKAEGEANKIKKEKLSSKEVSVLLKNFLSSISG